ncbi:MAG: response regulator [Thermodesulfobacteriota bacterium]
MVQQPGRSFPQGRREHHGANSPENGGANPHSGRKQHLLFVDDAQALVKTLPRLLTALGYQVTSRTSSLAALEIFRSRPQEFSLVITDFDMPQMNGLELAQEIRQIRPGMPIILYSGYLEEDLGAKARELGITRHLLKPVSAREFDHVIRQALTAP